MSASDKRTIKIEIDQEMLEKFEALPKGTGYGNMRPWTEAEDALLLRFWPIKHHGETAKLLGVSQTTALKRYRDLQKNEN